MLWEHVTRVRFSVVPSHIQQLAAVVVVVAYVAYVAYVACIARNDSGFGYYPILCDVPFSPVRVTGDKVSSHNFGAV